MTHDERASDCWAGTELGLDGCGPQVTFLVQPRPGQGLPEVSKPVCGTHLATVIYGLDAECTVRPVDPSQGRH